MDMEMTVDMDIVGGSSAVDMEVESDSATVDMEVKSYVEHDTGKAGAAVLFTPQNLTEDQQKQARKNIGIKGNGSLIVNFLYSDDGETLTADKPYKELREAVSDGTMLFAEVEGNIYPLIDHIEGLWLKFGVYTRTTKGLVKRTIQLKNDDTVTYTDVQVTIDTIRFPSFSGKMLYVDNSGRPRPLKLGTGLKIENGVLMLDGTVTPDTPDTPSKTAICGTFLAGQVLCGEGI